MDLFFLTCRESLFARIDGDILSHLYNILFNLKRASLAGSAGENLLLARGHALTRRDSRLGRVRGVISLSLDEFFS